MTEEELNERRRKRAALLLLPLLLLGAGLCFWTLFASVSLGEAQSFIPAPFPWRSAIIHPGSLGL
jgi:hypothetical protein